MHANIRMTDVLVSCVKTSIPLILAQLVDVIGVSKPCNVEKFVSKMY